MGIWSGVVILGGTALAFWIAPRRYEGRAQRLRRLWSRVVEWSAVGLFAWVLLWGDWAEVATRLLGLENPVLVDEVAILAPLLVMLAIGWVASYPVERVGLLGAPPTTLRDHVGIRVRQAVGMLLPLLVLYGLGHDLIERWLPQTHEEPAAQLALLTVLSGVMLVLSPLFVRISWRTRRLASGPLRDRLEALSRRFRFRYTDILVWDTGGMLVNAGVTGVLPWFRYVILTDGLVDRLGPREVEAVFGHELGHIKHHHLAYLAFFFITSVGALSLVETLIHAGFETPVWQALWGGGSVWASVAEWTVLLGIVAVYVVVVFGHLSRRFERQADLFGCRVVSCDRRTCPPHADPEDPQRLNAEAPRSICPVGIEIFSKALREVALSNGLPIRAPSWRHGSIAQRLGFLEHVANRPEAVGRFQTSLGRLRWMLAVVLGLMLAVSLWLVPSGVP
jgi:STE24 endopeptidase